MCVVRHERVCMCVCDFVYVFVFVYTHPPTLNLGFSSSTSPMRAPELQAMNTRGIPRSLAYSLALKKKSSSATPKDPGDDDTMMMGEVMERGMRR